MNNKDTQKKDLTQKQVNALKVLERLNAVNENNSKCCKYLLDKQTNLLKELGFDTTRVNAINATLASLKTKELVKSKKDTYEEKHLTFYWLSQKGLEYLQDKKENN